MKKSKIIDCYKNGKKQCELYPDEMDAQELELALELQHIQKRVCFEREVKP